MTQPVILLNTPTDGNNPPILMQGQPAFGVGPNFTRMWVGDGTVNRLLLSNNPADNPIFETGGGAGGGLPEAPTDGQIYGRDGLAEDWEPVLPLSGGTITGGLTITVPVASTGLMVSGRGISYTTLGASGASIAFSYTGGTLYPFVNGVAGSGLLNLSGGNMTGALALATDPINPMQAATKQYVDARNSVGTTAPAAPNIGDTWLDSTTGEFMVWTGAAWVPVGGGGGGVTIGDTPPASPADGDLWFDSTEGNLYIWFTDASSSQWVVAVNPGGGVDLSGYLPLTGGQLTGTLVAGQGVPNNPAPLNPSLIGSVVSGINGLLINCYQSGATTWNYLQNAPAARLAMESVTAGELLFSVAQSGASAAAVTFTSAMTLDYLGNLIMNGGLSIPADTAWSTVSGSVLVAGSYGFNLYVSSTGGENWRALEAGFGAWMSFNANNGAWVTSVYPTLAAGASVGNPAGSIQLLQSGIFACNGGITSSGGRVLSAGAGSNPSLTALDTTGGGFACGIWASYSGAGGVDSLLNFGQMDGTGTPTGQLGYFNISGDFTIAGTLTQSSDDRIKTLIGDYDKSLEDIIKLQPISFIYLGNDSRIQPAERKRGGPYKESLHYTSATNGRVFYGLSAQALQEAFPECVSEINGYIDGSEVTDLREVDVSPLLYALINAVKELAAKVGTQ